MKMKWIMLKWSNYMSKVLYLLLNFTLVFKKKKKIR